MEPLFELPIRLPARGSHQVLRALHQQLRAAIVDGRLRPGLRLLSTRALASSHGVSRNTAVAAYDLLLSEGYVSMRQGSGCYVAQTVAVQNPSYPPMRAAFEATGAKLIAVPVDTDGMVIDRLPSKARVVCVTPSHQFPLGSAAIDEQAIAGGLSALRKVWRPLRR